MYAKTFSPTFPVRIAPFSTSKVVANLPASYEIKIIGNEYGWSKIATTINDQIVVGYISTTLIDIEDGAKDYLEISHD